MIPALTTVASPFRARPSKQNRHPIVITFVPKPQLLHLQHVGNVLQIFLWPNKVIGSREKLYFYSLAQQPLSIKVCLYHLVAFSDLLLITHSRIVSPTYGGTVHSGFEHMTGIVVKSYELTTVPGLKLSFSKKKQFLEQPQHDV